MSENGAAVDQPVLLRLAIAGPQAAAGRDEQGCNRRKRIGLTEHGAGSCLQAGQERMP